MKSYTDLKQSRKLAEILPIETADMFYRDNGVDVKLIWEHIAQKVTNPCWSLASLLDILKYPSLNQDIENKWSITDWTGSYPKSEYGFDNPVDACVEMIIKLKEKNFI